MNGPVELQKLNYYTYIPTSHSGLSFHKVADFCHGKQVNMLVIFLLLLQTLSENLSYGSQFLFFFNATLTLQMLNLMSVLSSSPLIKNVRMEDFPTPQDSNPILGYKV